MAQSTCVGCGAPIDIKNSVDGVVECDYCHRKNTVARSVSADAVNFLAIGEHALDIGKFDEAYDAYKKASELDKNESEAYFGMALAEFKVRYIKDEVNGVLQPICHEIGDKAFTVNRNYLAAIGSASEKQAEVYAERAEEIEHIRREFFGFKNNGLEYDCFICAKLTDADGNRTKDYKTADDIYWYLKNNGYKPFFSEYEVKGRTGSDYEALICYALSVSKCMIVVCGNEEYLQTPWVKNEYMRFIGLINDEQKERDSIAIAFSGKPIERLPGRIGKLQGVDMTSLGAAELVKQFVRNHADAQGNTAVRAESAGTIKSENGKINSDGVAKNNKLVGPSSKFRVMLLFAYFVFGTFIATIVPSHDDITFTVLYIIFAVSLIASTVMNLFKLSPLLRFIANVSLWIVDAIIVFVLTLIETGSVNSEYYLRNAAIFGGIVFGLLFIMQGLYEAIDFVNGDKIKKRLSYAAVGVAFVMLPLAVFACMCCGRIPVNDYGYIAYAMLFTAISVIAFALSYVYSKWLNIITAICGIPCGIMNILCVVLYITINDTVFDIYDITNVNYAIGIMILVIVGIIMSWFFEGYKPSLTANRIVSVITVLAVIPVFAFTCEAFAVNVVFGSSALFAAAVVRIVVLVATVIYRIKLFRPDLLIKGMRKGGEV